MRFKTVTLVKVVLFVCATGLLVGLVGLTFAQVRIEDSRAYSAEFSDASGLDNNVDVRVNGVPVGQIKSIERRDEGGVLVEFTVADDLTLTRATEARIRYANLTGDRYLELTQGAEAGNAEPLKPGGTIKQDQTQAALELDDLFAGFDPLMQALDPEEVNLLTANILSVTQGQSGAVESMLASVASFTSGLAERDALIGSVVNSLTTTLGTFDARRAEFDRLITGLDQLTSQLNEDRAAYGEALTAFSTLGTDIADFLEAIRPGFKANLDNLGAVAQDLNAEGTYIRDMLGEGALGLNRVARLGGNGSFFNFFLCGVTVAVSVPQTGVEVLTPQLWASDDRCVKGTN